MKVSLLTKIKQFFSEVINGFDELVVSGGHGSINVILFVGGVDGQLKHVIPS